MHEHDLLAANHAEMAPRGCSSAPAPSCAPGVWRGMHESQLINVADKRQRRLRLVVAKHVRPYRTMVSCLGMRCSPLLKRSWLADSGLTQLGAPVSSQRKRSSQPAEREEFDGHPLARETRPRHVWQAKLWTAP
jgi:hypothetical protein